MPQNFGPPTQQQHILDLHEDITGYRETERQLRADVASKDVLLQEMSHRVLNSFLLISGLLEVQALKSTDERVKQQLGIASKRVLSVGLVHRRLYESAETIEIVNAKFYLTGLSQELRQGFFSADDNLRTLSLEAVDDINLSTDRMAYIGLIVSELVTNACKHAYKADEAGVVSVSLKRYEKDYILIVGDSGRGLAPGIDLNRSRGLGMSIIKMQVSELGGTLTVDTALSGIRFIIHIPV